MKVHLYTNHGIRTDKKCDHVNDIDVGRTDRTDKKCDHVNDIDVG